MALALAAEYESATWNGTWPKTLSVTTSVGDVLVVAASHAEYNGTSDQFLDPTGGTGLVWTKQQFHNLTSNSCLYAWTATAITAESFTLSVNTNGGSPTGGLDVTRWSGASGVIVSSKGNGTGAPSLAITAGAAGSVVIGVFGDWNESTIVGRVWRTINSITPTSGNGLELVARDISGQFTSLQAYWNDAGAAGSKTTGLTTPSGTKWTGIAIEVQAAAGGSTHNGAMVGTGTSALTASALVTHKANPAALASTSALTCSARVIHKGSAAALASTSTLTGSAQVTHRNNTAAFASASALTGSGFAIAKGNAAAFASASALTALALVTHKGNAASFASVSLLTWGGVSTVNGAASFAGTSALTASAFAIAKGNAISMGSTSTLTGVGKLTARAGMTLSSVSSFSAAGRLRAMASAAFASTSLLVVSELRGPSGPRHVTIISRSPRVSHLGGIGTSTDIGGTHG